MLAIKLTDYQAHALLDRLSDGETVARALTASGGQREQDDPELVASCATALAWQCRQIKRQGAGTLSQGNMPIAVVQQVLKDAVDNSTVALALSGPYGRSKTQSEEHACRMALVNLVAKLKAAGVECEGFPVA